MKWKWLILIVMGLEVATLVCQFGVPALQGRVFGDPNFPHLIVMHGDVPHSDIVDSRGNFFVAATESTVTYTVIVFGIALVSKMARSAKNKSG